jgi:Type I phosphodiesterase / nucleotide pyrophosphatase
MTEAHPANAEAAPFTAGADADQAAPVGGPASGPAVPRYGESALADLTPSVLAALGVAGASNVLGLPELPRACVLLVDGLGWELLRAHPEEAPFLASLAGRALTAGFPATTATSLGSFGTGRPPGGHGLFGYTFAIPGTGRLLNCLRWTDQVDPLVWVPGPTVFERAVAAGVSTSHISARAYKNSGLTRAVYRGARYVAADSLGQLVAMTERELRKGDRSFVTVYHSDLDSTGHLYGSGSTAWRHQLVFVDLLARRIAEVLPPDAALYVTADHGMTNPSDRVDADREPGMRDGVALLGGEARARHVYAAPGAAGDVLATWTELIGDRAWVMSRADAVEAGLFGAVSESLRPRIGDVVAIPHGELAIVASETEAGASALVGMHGSVVAAEQLVPLLSFDGETTT